MRGIESDHLGLALVERTSDGFVDGVCVKKKGIPLAVPAAMLVAADPVASSAFVDKPRAYLTDGYFKRFCAGDPERGVLAYGPNRQVSICTWNGKFHSARPFTFTLVTNLDAKVADFIDLVRVYRNGDLMAAWNQASDQPDPTRIVISGAALSTGFWAASLPPHRAAMDLRMVAHENSVAAGIDLVVRNDKDRARKRAEAVLKSVADDVLPLTSPAYQSLQCLKQAVIDGREQVMKLVRGDGQVAAPAQACSLPLGLAAVAPLSDTYKDMSNQTREKLEVLTTSLETDLDGVRKRVADRVKAKAEELFDKGLNATLTALSKKTRDTVALAVGSAPASSLFDTLRAEQATLMDSLGAEGRNLYETLYKLSHDVDAQVRFAMQGVDDARATALSLSDEAEKLLTDPSRQAHMFNALAQDLAREGEVFESRRENPVLIANEQILSMEYADNFQGFFVAPWHGVPIRWNDNAKADLNAATALPLIDILGMRLQWGKSRLGDARLAVGLGYISTVAADTTNSNSSRWEWLPFGSVGLGTFKLGVGLAGWQAKKEAVRVLVGVDLFKLITGKNVELL